MERSGAATAVRSHAPSPGASGWDRDYQRVAAAIAWLDANRRAQPQLDELAAALHLSPGHLQRTFTRFAGTSPARFLRWLTAGAARDLLRDRATVLETTAAVGLSSGGRLHGLLVTLDAVTPGELGRGGAGLEVRVGEHPTPLGPVAVAVTERGVLDLRFVDRGERPDGDPSASRGGVLAGLPAATIVPDEAATLPVAEHLVATLGDAADGEPLRVAAVGTNLQLKVWEALLRIPTGRVVSYGEVARAAGRPEAVRAVAGAIGRNPVAALIPCHRVLRATGELGGYRWGTVRKRALLAREAARHER